MTNIKNAILYRYGIFRFAQENVLYFKEETNMSKEIYSYSNEETNAIISETKYQLLMRLFYRFNNNPFVSDTNFKSLQDELKLFEVCINKDHPTLLVSRKAFLRALNRAKQAGWIYLKRRHTALAGKLFEVGLTPKGEQIAQKEWEILCSNS